MLEVIIVIAIILYSVWIIRKERKDLKNGACCGGCSSCPVGNKCSVKIK